MHGADDRGIDIEDDQLEESPWEKLRNDSDSDPLIFIMIRPRRAAYARIQIRRKIRI